MFKEMKKRIKNEKGLTLIELLAVIVILAIISAIAIPAIGNIIENSRFKAAKSDALNVINAAQIYLADSNTSTVTLAALETNGAIDELGTFDTLSATEKAAVKITKAASGGVYIEDATVVFSGTKTVTFENADTSEINNNGTGTTNKDKSAKELLSSGKITITGATKN